MPKSEYRCQKCHFQFSLTKPQPVDCPKCNHNYVDWINYREVLNWLYLNDSYFKENGYAVPKIRTGE